MVTKKRRKTRLGQHFLRSEAALKRIIDAAQITSEETVLEIGPGRGVLTHELLARAKKVIAVEKDPALVQVLRERFKKEIEEKKFLLVHADIRSVQAETLLLPDGYKLVANIPYYITGEIIRIFLTSKHQPSQMTLLVQDEVAKRIAKETKESILSISVKVFGKPHYIAKVPRGAFAPSPEVDSAVLTIEDISRKNFINLDEYFFFTVVRKGFGSKRKQLLGNLSALASREKLQSIFSALGIAENVRAEDVELRQWLALAKALDDMRPQ